MARNILSNQDYNGNKIVNLGDGTSDGDAVNKSQLDTKADSHPHPYASDAHDHSEYLPLTGGTLVGDLTLQDAATATKAYRMRSSGGALDFEAGGANMYYSIWSGADFTGTQHQQFEFDKDGGAIVFKKDMDLQGSYKISNLNGPFADGDATPRSYVDDQVATKADSGHAHTIDDLADVDTSTDTPEDGQALVWDTSGAKWQPGTIASGSSSWGSITGTLSDQTDLQTALDAKVSDTGDSLTGQYTITNSGTTPALKIDQQGTTTRGYSSGGALLLDMTNGGDGYGVNIYTNRGTSSGSLGAPLKIHAANADFDSPLLYIYSAGTDGSAANIRLDGYYPDIEFQSLQYTKPNGCFEVDVGSGGHANGSLRINSRNAANNSYETVAHFTALKDGGDMVLGGGKVKGLSDGTDATDAATKSQVDSKQDEITFDTTAPSSPTLNQLWWDTTA